MIGIRRAGGGWKVSLTLKNTLSRCLISFLECGVDENLQEIYETILLHSASYQGTPEIVETLLDHGAKLNAKNHWGESVLHAVSRGTQDSQGGVSVAKLLLDRGVDVNTRREDECTPLLLASYLGKLEMVRLLLDHGAEANVEAKEGLKLLHAVALGSFESQEDGVRIAELLLKHGAEVDAQSEDHWTPLHVACRHGKLEMVRLLLDHGAEVNAETVDGEKPLRFLSYGNYRSQEDGVRVAHLLLERGADINTRCNDHSTLLHAASYSGNVEIARLLLDHGADPEANAEGDRGDKPLHQVSAGKYKSPEDGVRVAQLLLERGADISTRRDDDQTPLHVASYFRNVEIVCLFLDHGADPEANAEGSVGEKPLHRVSYGDSEYGSPENGVRVAQLLLERGADVSTRRNDQWTPLHVASHLGEFGIVQVLIDHDAEVDAVDDFGKTPLHEVSQGIYESQEEGVRIAQLLLDHGADVNAKSSAGDTPLTFASRGERPKLAELLLEHAANINVQRPSANSN